MSAQHVVSNANLEVDVEGPEAALGHVGVVLLRALHVQAALHPARIVEALAQRKQVQRKH